MSGSWRAVPPVHSPISIGAVATAAFSHDPEARVAVERRIRDELGPRELALTDTGTSALRLALEMCAEIRPGPVALPAYGCYDLLSAAHGADVPIAFYDVSPRTLGPDLDSLERVLRDGAGTIVVAHLFGVPVDIREVRALSSRFGALLIEDAAQGVGGEWEGRPLGVLGDLGVLSFARGKGRTGGSGGALLSMLPEPPVGWERVGRLPAAGGRAATVLAAAAMWLLGRPSAYRIPLGLPGLGLGETHYREPRDPAAMPLHAATILAASWGAAGRELAHRRETADTYRRWIEDRPGRVRTIEVPEGGRAGYLRFPILDSGSEPAVASARFGIARGYPRPLPSVGRGGVRLGPAGVDTPGAAVLARQLHTLPTHSRLAARDLQGILSWLERIS